jgi:hypothetical protein
MIYTISRELDAALNAKGVPLRVVYGPESTDGVTSRERIVMQRAEDGNPTMRGTKGNPGSSLMARGQGVTIRVYARSPIGGAQQWDHERRADLVVDRIMFHLETLVRVRRNTLTWGRCGFRKPAEVSLETELPPWPGVVYEMQCQIDRGVFDRAWPTAESPEGAIAEEAIIGTDVTIERGTPNYV